MLQPSICSVGTVVVPPGDGLLVSQHLSLCDQCDSSAVAVGPAVTMLGTRGRPELAVGGEAG